MSLFSISYPKAKKFLPSCPVIIGLQSLLHQDELAQTRHSTGLNKIQMCSSLQLAYGFVAQIPGPVSCLELGSVFLLHLHPIRHVLEDYSSQNSEWQLSRVKGMGATRSQMQIVVKTELLCWMEGLWTFGVKLQYKSQSINIV